MQVDPHDTESCVYLRSLVETCIENVTSSIAAIPRSDSSVFLSMWELNLDSSEETVRALAQFLPWASTWPVALESAETLVCVARLILNVLNGVYIRTVGVERTKNTNRAGTTDIAIRAVALWALRIPKEYDGVLLRFLLNCILQSSPCVTGTAIELWCVVIKYSTADVLQAHAKTLLSLCDGQNFSFSKMAAFRVVLAAACSR